MYTIIWIIWADYNLYINFNFTLDIWFLSNLDWVYHYLMRKIKWISCLCMSSLDLTFQKFIYNIIYWELSTAIKQMHQFLSTSFYWSLLHFTFFRSDAKIWSQWFFSVSTNFKDNVVCCLSGKHNKLPTVGETFIWDLILQE